jgi:hypothetical protein
LNPGSEGLNPYGVGGTYARGIDGGKIVGYYQDSGGTNHGFLYNGSSYTTLDDPDGLGGTWAVGISGSKIVGYFDDGYGTKDGFVFDGTTYTTVDDPYGDLGTIASGISGNTIIGWYSNSPGIDYGFIYNMSQATPSMGSLEVMITPAGAEAAGARWNVDGGSWQSSGATESGLATGKHAVNFSDVSGYTTPAPETANILANQTVTTTGTYVATIPTGSVEVMLIPAGAVKLGAQWKIDDGSWKNSDTTVTGLTTGSHAVSFNPVAGYTAPASESVSVVANQAAVITGTYTEMPPVTPFPGTYEGLFLNGGSYSAISISLSAGGSATGKVSSNGGKRSLKGKFIPPGVWEGNYSGYALLLELAPGEAGIPGSYSISGSAGGAALIAFHTAYDKGHILAEAGKHMLQLTAATTGAGIPKDSGTAALTVSTTGGVRLSGTLPDGESFITSATIVGGLSGDQFIAYCPLDYKYVTPRGARGYLIGAITFPSGAATGSLTWIKPPQTKGRYPAPIDTSLNLSP